MGQIKAYYTCTRVKWEEDEDGNPTEEHGWVDRSWSPTLLHDSRNDVRPFIDLPSWSKDLADEVREAVEWLEGGFEDNGDGTFYSADSYQPYTEPWRYSYAVHFSRKFFGPDGWTEQKWHPVTDGGIEL